jgi:hypothetical protein
VFGPEILGFTPADCKFLVLMLDVRPIFLNESRHPGSWPDKILGLESVGGDLWPDFNWSLLSDGFGEYQSPPVGTSLPGDAGHSSLSS